MTAIQTLLKVRRCGVTLVPSEAGDRLRFHPASALTPELVEELRQHKESILEILTPREVPPDPRPPIGTTCEVLELACKLLPELKDEDRVDLNELIQANSPPDSGRDPMVKRGTDKAWFFKGDWRGAWPPDYRVYRDGGPAA